MGEREPVEYDPCYDARPDPRFLLRAIASATHQWKSVLGELIDNSLDAKARRIVITLMRKEASCVRVEDDGRGCRQLANFIKLGRHEDHGAAGVGRFGIGAKDAMLWIGHLDDETGHVNTATAIQSTRGGVTRELHCNWQELAAADWQMQRDWLLEYKATTEQRGTCIEIRPCRRTIPTGENLAKLAEELGYYYFAAIARGARIELRVDRAQPLVLQPWQLPELTDVVDATIDVDGRRARVRAGILVGGACKRRGITYTHLFRVIIEHGALGCGQYSHAGVCGVVELDHTWHLTKNKDDVVGREALGDAVYCVIRDLLAKAEARSQSIQFERFDSNVQAMLNALVDRPDAKALRPNRHGSKGTKSPTGRGAKHKRGAVEGAGETFARLSKALSLEFADLGDAEKLGESSGNNIILNLANPFIAQVRGGKNEHATVALGTVVFANGQRAQTPTGQRNLRFESTGDLVQDIAWLLARPIFIDGERLEAPADAAEE